MRTPIIAEGIMHTKTPVPPGYRQEDPAFFVPKTNIGPSTSACRNTVQQSFLYPAIGEGQLLRGRVGLIFQTVLTAPTHRPGVMFDCS